MYSRGGQIIEMPTQYNGDRSTHHRKSRIAGHQKPKDGLLYGSGCNQGGPSCFDCTLPECQWSQWGKNGN
jgi:hypothetical protein